MNVYQVTHITQYEFSKTVVLEPHTVRLYPKAGRGQRLLSHTFKSEPEPASLFLGVDISGIPVYHLAFGEMCGYLQIESAFEMELDRDDNPFGYVVYPFECATLPLVYPVHTRYELDAFIKSDYRSAYVDGFARQLAEAAGMNTVAYLSILASCLCDTVKHATRESGAANGPEETLRARQGSCRDSAVLYMEACRCMGVAARFVSGYVLKEHEETAQHLHAWVEAYIPGAGWVGYDPSLGLACGAEYVAVAAARNPADAAPVSGVFRGNGAVCSLSYSLSIRETQHVLIT